MGLLSKLGGYVAGWFRAAGTRPSTLDQMADMMVEKIRTASTGGQITFLPYLDALTEETDEIRAQYRLMLREPVIKSALLTKVLAVSALSLQCHPADKDDPNAVDQAAFVKRCFDRMKGTTRRTARNILLPGLMDGWSLQEKIWETAADEPDKGKWVWKAWKNKDTKHLRLAVDDYNSVIGIQANTFNTGQVYDPNDFVIWSNLDLFENPRGLSDLRAAYRAYWMKNTIWNLRGLHLEKFTSPFLMGTYPAGSNDVKVALEAALQRAKASTWLAVPTGALVQAIEMSTKGTTDFEAGIQDCDRDMLVGIYGSYLSILEGKTTGARAMGEVHQETAELFQWSLAAEIGDVYSDEAKELCQLNYAVPAPPTVTLEAISEADLLARSQVDEALQRMGLKLSKKEAYNAYGRTEPEDEADELVSVLAAAPPAMFSETPFAEPPEVAPKYIDQAMKDLSAKLGL